MRSYSVRWSTGMLAAALGLLAVLASAQRPLFTDVAGSVGNEVHEERASDLLGEAAATARPGALPARVVGIDTARLTTIRADIEVRRISPTVLLNLFDGIAYAAVFERAEATSSGYSLTGRLSEVGFGTVTLVVDGDIVAGTVRTPQATYAIRSAGLRIHSVREVEPPVLTENDVVESRHSAPPRLPKVRQSSDAAAEDDGSEIDVLVFHTRDARMALGGVRRSRAQIDLAVAETNAAYEAGGAVQRIRLVGAVETDYAETDNSLVDLGRFEDDGDGHMDDVHVLRDAYAADLLVLVVDGYGGWSSVAPYDPAAGFSLSGVSADKGSWLSTRVFAHELGHNMGLQHDRYVNPGNRPFPYAHGYVNQAAFDEGAPDDACWHTIMAYSRQCWDAGLESVPILRFSNPGQRYPDEDGDPMGVPGDGPSDAVDGPADAVRTLNATRLSVANFRSSARRCVYRVSPLEFEVGADGGSFAVEVEAEGEGCPREAKTHDGFLALEAGGGEGGFRFRVEPNDGWARFGAVTVAAETIEVRQEGGRAMTAVCDRSPWMRDATTVLAGREDCAAVTEFDVASIRELDLRFRDIEGTVRPGDFDGFASLVVLDLAYNRLSGVFPDVAGLRTLAYLDLSGNGLNGNLPTRIGNLDRLSFLRLGRNAFTGAVPPALGSLGRLIDLDLHDNLLTGPVPAELGRLGLLQHLLLSGNDLTGPVPRALAKLRLYRLEMQRNRLDGCIPGALGRFADDINPQRGADGSTERILPPCPAPGEAALVIEWARDGRLTVSYGASSEGEPVSGYEYRLSTDWGATWTADWTTIPESGLGEANAETYTIEGLADGTRYTLEMRAVNADGAGPAASVSVVLGAWLPGRLEVSDEPGELRVFWDAVEGAVSYVVEWRNEHQEFHESRRREFRDGTTMTTISGLNGDTLYFVRVSAVLDSTQGYSPVSIHSVVTTAQHRPFLRGWRLAIPFD